MSLSIVFFVVPDFELLDLSGPLCVFNLAAKIQAGTYHVALVSTQGGPVGSSCGVVVDTASYLPGLEDSVIVVGGPAQPEAALDVDTCRLLMDAAGRARRVVSVCTGAFILAAVGLLDGKRATTHWRYADRLQRDYPQIKVTPDSIYVQHEAVWTSAGITAAIDLALRLVQDDYGLALSKLVAREMVVYNRRQGGQTQYSIPLQLETQSDRLQRVLAFIRNHLSERLPAARLAAVAHLSERQLGRLFKTTLGATPTKVIEAMRVELALPRIREGTEAMEGIARSIGFADADRMRLCFVRVMGSTPQVLREAARNRTAAA